jgi:hypothetical protein
MALPRARWQVERDVVDSLDHVLRFCGPPMGFRG